MLAPYQKSVSWDQIMAAMGNSAIKVCQKYCTMFNLNITPQEYLKKVSSFYPEVLPAAKLMEGNFVIRN